MAIIAKSEGKSYPQAPDGQHVSVCCDVVDKGVVRSVWDGVEKRLHKIHIWFQIIERDENQNRILVGKYVTLSMHEKANLRKFLESWRGKPYTEDQAAAGIDVENMIGVPAYIQTALNKNKYADITSIMRLPKSMEAITPVDFIRFKDRIDAATNGTDEPPPPEEDFDDLPF